MAEKKRRRIDPSGKRDAILKAGEMLFAAQGYTNTSIADIAAQAGVAVGTVYRLFPDKSALLATLHRAMENRFIGAMLEGWRSQTNYSDRFDFMIDALFLEASNMRHIMSLYALTRDIAQTTDYVPGQNIVKVITELYEQGAKTKAYVDLEPLTVANIAHGMVDGAMRTWMENPTENRKEEVVSVLKLLFRRSFVSASVETKN